MRLQPFLIVEDNKYVRKKLRVVREWYGSATGMVWGFLRDN